MDQQEWIARCTERLHQQWPNTVEQQPQQTAEALNRLDQWRRHGPEVAAVMWLRLGAPLLH